MSVRRIWVAKLFAAATALNLALSLPAPAQDVAIADLMTPPPLGDMSLGNPGASVTVIEYASLWCSHCGQFHRTLYPQFKQRYIDTGKINFIFRELPINERGAAGSMLARCAARDGGKDKFFAVVDTLFDKQDTWAYAQDPGPPLLLLAKQLGFTEQTFDACLADQKQLDALRDEQNRAISKFGVDATPTFIINGKKIKGVESIRDLTNAIDPLLKD